MTDEFAKVQSVLTKLPIVLQKKVVVGATRAGAKVIAKEAQRLVPVRSGILKRSIGVAKAKKKDTPEGVVRFYIVPKTKVNSTSRVLVGGKSAKIKAKLSSYHGHFVEFGTDNMDEDPYLYPSAKSKKDETVKAFQNYTIIRTEKEVRKLAR